MDDDDFDAAFAQAISDDAPPAESAPAESAPAPAEGTPAPAPAEGTPAPAEGTPAEGAPAAPAETAPAAPAAPAESAPAAPAEPAAPAAPAPVPAPQVAPEAPPAPPAPPMVDPYEALSTTDKEALAAYAKEYPEIAKAQELHTQVVMGRALQQFALNIAQTLAPLVESVNAYRGETHESAIARAHPDYAALTPDLVNWVNTRPAFARDAYTQTLQNGGTQAVIELLSEFKEATGRNKTAPAEAPASAPAPVVPNPAAQALAPVTAKRSSPPRGAPDPNDFDGAFAEAAQTLD